MFPCEAVLTTPKIFSKHKYTNLLTINLQLSYNETMSETISFDPTSDPVIPYFRRLRLEFNLTQDELAREARTSRLAILRNEHLCYPDPLPNIATHLSLFTDVPLKNLQHEYHIDVFRRRTYTSEVLLPLDSDDSNLLDEISFHDFRQSKCRAVGLPTSLIKFSSMICVHPSTIATYEFAQTRNLSVALPRALAVALREMHWLNVLSRDSSL